MTIIKKNQLENVLYIQQDISQVNAPQFRSEFFTILQSNDFDCLWLDMSQVNFIDSVGIGIIATAYSTVKQQSRNLVICKANPPVRMVFELTGLDQVLQFSDQTPGLPTSKLKVSSLQQAPLSVSMPAK